jgi:S1-C subfamily serine protease
VTGITIDPFKVTGRFTTSTASGFIVDAKGLVLTNAHTVYGRNSIIVTLDGGQTTDATLLGADPILDVAVLRIPVPPGGLTAASLGNSNTLQVGEEVVAIGNPFGLEQTLAHGLISGINRILTVSPLGSTLPLIQTDAAINLGSSGGPLINRCGEAIGITTSMLRYAENIGFALPINVAREVLPQLVNQGRVIRPWLGVRGRLITSDELSGIFNLPLADGFLVETIDPGSPAEESQLRGGQLPVVVAGEEYLLGGDIITAVNGKSVADARDLEKSVRSLKVGQKVSLNIHRAGQKLQVELTLTERPVLPGDFLPTDQAASWRVED